jgi:glycosyltransferase involved in cell wall biosynthesis
LISEFFMSADLLPLSVVIPTLNRPAVLRRTLESLAGQSAQPGEIVIIDASEGESTRRVCVKQPILGLGAEVIWRPARMSGAASQRNLGVQECRHKVIGFFDDDILFEPDCIARLWRAMQSDDRVAGVNAMIINQRYQRPGRVSRLMFRLMAGRREDSYAGRVLGPAVNLLPEDCDYLPDVVPIEWLNTTCTLYRREALPQPPFPDDFTGYSLMEDLALSLTVGKQWKLANARTARIYHDSQPGRHKNEAVATSRMELVNRHYVMTKVLGKCGLRDYARLALWELFQLANCAIDKRGGIRFWRELRGKMLGLCNVVNGRMRRGHR